MNRTITRARPTPAALILAAGASLTLTAAVLAAPQGAQVKAGQAQFSQSGNTTTITTSHKAVIDYTSFNIAGHETVQFVQPNARSRVLNRVNSALPTQIDGALLANGQVFIVNPSGVIFGANSIVNVGTLFAGAGNITNNDFMSGNFRFTNVTGDITAHGLITADAIHLIGSRIANHGTIIADNGIVSMLVGNDVLIRQRGSSVSVRFNDVSGAMPVSGGPQIENTGTIRANNGTINLGAGDAVSLAIRNSGSMIAGDGEINARAGSMTFDQGDVTAVAGNFNATAMDDITLLDPINNIDGAINLLAGRDIIFETTNPFTINQIEAESIDFNAGRNILDNTLFGTQILARSGNASLTAQTGFLEFGKIGTVNTDARVILTQADSMFFRTSGTGGLLLNPLGQRLTLNVTGLGAGQGNLTIGGDFGGIGSEIQHVGELVANATRDINVWNSVQTNATVGPMTGLNGPISLVAGNNIHFGIPSDAPFIGGPTMDLALTGSQIDLFAQNFINDSVILGTGLNATVGDVNATAVTGRVEFGIASVPANNYVRITQGLSRFVGANFGFLANPETTNLEVRITAGDLTFGGDFGGTTGQQEVLSLYAESAQNIFIDDDLTMLTFGRFYADDNIDVRGFTRTDFELTMHAARDGSGTLRFLEPGLDIAGDRIELIAGIPNSTAGSGVIDALSFSPSIYGSSQQAGFESTSPTQFLFRQDVAVTDMNLPSGSQFGAGPSGVLYTAQSFNSNVILDSGEKVTGSQLTLISASGNFPANTSRSFINDDLDLASLTVQGRSTLNANVDSNTFQLYNGEVRLGTDATLIAGTSVTFNGPVDATTLGGQGLTVATAGNTLIINDHIGAVIPLAFLDVTGTATLNNAFGLDPVLVRTVGNQSWNGGVTLLDNARLVTTEASTIRFGSTLDGAFDLDLQTNLGFVRFADTVGGSERLGRLYISSAGESGVRAIPDRATIIGENGLLLFATEFVMNQHEKLTALGDLTINATSFATLGDLNSSANMLVEAPIINLLRRQPATLLTSAGVLVEDLGLDFVARGTINVNGTLVLAGDPLGTFPLFGNNTGGTLVTNLGNIQIVNLPNSFTLESGLVLEPGATILDQRVILPATGLNSLIDQSPFFPEFDDSVTPRPFDLELLALLGIDGLTPTIDITGPGTANTFADIPANDPNDDVDTVTATRITVQAVSTVVDRYEAVFGPRGSDQADNVRNTVQQSIRSYMSLSDAAAFDPQGFRNYMANDPATDRLADDFGTLLASMRELGLNRREFERARNRLLAPVLEGVDGVTPADFEQSLRADTRTGDRIAINR